MKSEDGAWPGDVQWPSGPGADERHWYRYVGVKDGIPKYTHVRPLKADEPAP